MNNTIARFMFIENRKKIFQDSEIYFVIEYKQYLMAQIK